ncbi:MAG: hypothetical protein WC455_04020 [Dehalococcoidia bacterium]
MKVKRILKVLLTCTLLVTGLSCDGSGSTTHQPTTVIEEETGMDEAIAVVVEDILPNVPEVAGGLPYMCLKLDSILPRGTRIEEDYGQNLSLTLEEDSYFFYLDLEPGAFYGHPVQYILVDEDGNHEEYEANWWPRINDSVPDGLVRTIPDDDDVFSTNVEIEESSGTPLEFDFPVLPLEQCEGFIVVQGLMPYESLFTHSVNDYANRLNFFNAYRSSCSEIKGLVQDQADDVFDEIDNMVAANLNPITISIIAHGGDSCIWLGGQQIWDRQFRSKMAEYPDTTFNLMLTSCYSGSFTDVLQTLDNVCVISTACSAEETTHPDWDNKYGQTDFNPADIGAEWTSSIIEAMWEIAGDSDTFDQIVSVARLNGVSTTCVLICEGHYGALGGISGFGLNQNLDLCSRLGKETPQLYCAWETSE